MGLLILPFVGIMFAAFVVGIVRGVRSIGRSESLRPGILVSLLVILLWILLGLSVPLIAIRGSKIYGWSLLFDLCSGWIAGGVSVAVVLEVTRHYTKKYLLEVASSAVLVATGLFLPIWFVAGKYLLGVFRITIMT